MQSTGRRDYGYINGTIAANDAYPLTIGDLIAKNNTEGTWYLVNSFTMYTRCFADVVIAQASTPDKVVKRVGFRSLDNIVEWINNNVASGGGFFTQGCKIRIYDEVDGDIPPIRKVYGKNTRKASLSGGYYYNGSHVPGPDWNGAASFLSDVWADVVGSVMPAPGAWTPAEYGCFWFSGSRRSFYSCPSPSLVRVNVPILGAEGRNMRRLADGLRVPAAAGNWSVGQADLPLAVVNGKDGVFFATHRIARGNLVMTGWNSDCTCMVAYPLTDALGNQAILLKPLGVDSFYLNYFDTTRYQLEQLCSRGEQESWPRLNVLDTSAAFSYPEGDSLGPIELGPMMTAAVNPKHFGNRRYRPSDIYFQLRDLRTNRVSTVSPQRIAWTMHRGSAIVAPQVSTRTLT